MIVYLFVILLAWSFVGTIVLVTAYGLDQLDDLTERQKYITVFLLAPIFCILYLIGGLALGLVIFIAKLIDSLITKQ